MNKPHPGPDTLMSSLLDTTLAASIRDVATVRQDGESLQQVVDGVKFREAVTHVDERGSVVELYDPRWDWHPEPLVFAYSFTIRPGFVKGWNLHREHEDRYFVLQGELQLILYDVRPEISDLWQGLPDRFIRIKSALGHHSAQRMARRLQHRHEGRPRGEFSHAPLRSREPGQISPATRHAADPT